MKNNKNKERDNSLPSSELMKGKNTSKSKFPKQFNTFFQPGIYAIFNTKKNLYYIGETSNIASRLSYHFSQLQLKKHDCKNLQKDWLIYSEDVFEFQILEMSTKRWNDKIHRLQKERYYIQKYAPNVYNSLRKESEQRSTNYQPNSIPIIAYNDTFISISEASRFFGISSSTIRLRLNDPTNLNWKYKDFNQQSATDLARPVVVGTFYYASVSSAAANNGISENKVRTNIKKEKIWNYFDKLTKKEKQKVISNPKNQTTFKEGKYKLGRCVFVKEHFFPSIKSASKFFSIDSHTVRKRIKSPNFPDWKWG